MSVVSGTIRKVTINGVTYDVKADADVSFNPSNKEKEGIPTTGRTLIKHTRRVPIMENVPLVTDANELEAIKVLSNGIVDVTIAVQLASGHIYRGTGQITITNYSTAESITEITAIPAKSTDNAWTLFQP